MGEKYTPEWAKFLPEDEFISSLPSYEGGNYLDLFDEFSFAGGKIGNFKYYLYNPVKHGANANEKYPLLVFFHGFSCALSGKMCISQSGGELFASPDYQQKMGGAFVLVPIANEKCDENGIISGSFNEDYLQPLNALISKTAKENSCDGIFVIGGSLGGTMTWKIAEKCENNWTRIMPVSTDYIPDEKVLRRFEQQKISVYYSCGIHDEFMDFEGKIKPKTELLSHFGNILCRFPEWVKNGDGGVASLFYGREMGQHCIIN